MTATDTALGARVRTLRERAGVKSQHLAQVVGIDPSAMSNIESGKRAVKTDELARIAQALGVSPLAILDESSLLARLPVAPRTDGDHPLAGSALERLTALAELHDVLTHEGIPASPLLDNIPEIDVQDWKRSAERLAAWVETRLEVGVSGDERFLAIADAIEDRLQLDVLIEDHADAGLVGAAITDRSFPLVFVRASQPRPRALFTLAHELAHVLVDDGESITLDTDLSAHSDRERLANAFAATYLMPATTVAEVHDQHGLRPAGLAHMLVTFGVSYESLVYRLHNLGYINYEGRNHLRGGGIRAVLADLDDEDLTRSILARLAERPRVERRPPAWLAGRALAGYRRGVVSVRPLAGLLGVDADELLTNLEASLTTDAATVLSPAGPDSSDEERYSGNPV
jgi:Zn-dependent peptidase ImmA (M78 family)/DNA-binding XRE family transcriptional regulator